MPEIRQYHTCSHRIANFHSLFSSFRAMWSWHSRAISFGKRTIENCCSSNRFFTKWVEAESLATISEPKLRSFIWKSIVCRFGIPNVFITNNGRQFDNSKFRNFCANLRIDHHLTSVSYPKSNGLAEELIGLYYKIFEQGSKILEIISPKSCPTFFGHTRLSIRQQLVKPLSC